MYADCVLAATRLSRCTSGTCRDAAPDGPIPFSVRLAPPLPLRPSSPDHLGFGLFQLRYSPPLADSHRPSLRSADESRWGRQDRVLWRLSGRRDGWGASIRPRGARWVAIRAGSRRRFWTRVTRPAPQHHQLRCSTASSAPCSGAGGSRVLGIGGIRLFSSGSSVSDSTCA